MKRGPKLVRYYPFLTGDYVITPTGRLAVVRTIIEGKCVLDYMPLDLNDPGVSLSSKLLRGATDHELTMNGMTAKEKSSA